MILGAIIAKEMNVIATIRVMIVAMIRSSEQCLSFTPLGSVAQGECSVPNDRSVYACTQ